MVTVIGGETFSSDPSSNFYKVRFSSSEHHRVIKVHDTYKIPEFDLVIDDNGNFVLTEEKFDIDSVTILTSVNDESSIKISKKNMTKIPHDMVLSYFCKVIDKDISFEEMFGSLGDRNLDIPTPDIHLKSSSPGDSFICEIATTMSPNGSESALNKKLNKYIDICRVRNVKLKIIAVSSSEVSHNVRLDYEDCKALCSRYLYGLEIKNRAKELGWDEPDETPESDLVEKSFKEFSFFREFDDPLCSTGEKLTEINSEYATKWISDAKETFTSDFIKKVDHKSIAKSYLDKIDELGNRTDGKAVSPTCQFILSKKSYCDNSVPSLGESDHFMNKFWFELFSKYEEDDEEGQTYDDCTNIYMEVEEEYEERDKNTQKSERHLYKLPVDNGLESEMAVAGVMGKKHKNDVDKVEHQIESRKSFKTSTDVSDIDRFLDGYGDLLSDWENPLNERYDFLTNYAEEMNHKTSLVKQLLNTKLCSCLSTFSAIMCEININSNKKMKGREWSVVNHPSLPCYIAIHTTKSSSHIFYSVLFNKDDSTFIFDRPFRQVIYLSENYVCTPICSLTRHDLSIWISMPNIFMSSFCTLADVSDYDLYRSDFRKHPLAVESMYIVLQSLENKETTSSCIFNVRYMYMEMIKPKEITCSPFKVLSKFPTVIRSRLLLWNILRTIQNFTSMLEVRDIRGENSPILDVDEDDYETELLISRDNVPNLTSHLSGTNLKSFEQAINLSYLGVFHNVDKGESTHGYLKIFSKVIKEELLLRESDINKMTDHSNEDDGPLSYKSHEFSPNHMRKIAQILKKKLRQKGITSFEIRKQIFRNLSRITFSELATFKASANSENFVNSDDPDWADYIQNPRNKALEEILNLIDEIGCLTAGPYSNLTKVFEKLSETGGIIANLFKKSQPTGVREIFVLTMISRIVMRLLESISRTLCNMCENEYLTKGDRKSTASIAHFASIKSKKKPGDISITVTDSCDATTWCQKFVMPVFQTFFNELFDSDDDILKVITFILNFMTLKRLELPMSLLNLFQKNQDIVSFDEGMNELKSQFLGKSEFSDLIGAGKVLMSNRSNFMQGIMHYTSSLIHAAHMLWIEECFEALFLRYFGEFKESLFIETKTKVSSDDQSRQSTVIIREDKVGDTQLLKKVRLFLLFTSSLLKTSYPLMASKLSEEKSSMYVLCNIEEFNSEWTVVNTVITPKIKWSYSSQIIQTTNSIVERQNVDHGLVNDLTENGCRRLTTQVCEFGCMLNHYSLLGFHTLRDNFFQDLFSNIFRVRSNMCGFYLLSHDVIGTSLGFPFTKWLNISKFKNVRLSENVSVKSCFGIPQPDGSMDFSLTLPIGFGINYRKFLKKIGLTFDEVESEVDGRESILFGESNSVDDEKLKIKLKAISSGASKAFSFSSASKQHVTSSYINTTACMNGRFNKILMKYSLPAALTFVEENWDKEFVCDDVLYPQMSLYESICNRISNVSYFLVRGRRRKKLTKLKIPNLSRVSHIPLITVLKKKWFRMDVEVSKFQIESSFEKYCSTFPWLSETFKESFDNYKEIFGDVSKVLFSQHITNLSHKDRTIKFHHQGNFHNLIEDQIIDCICMNFRMGHIYRKSQTVRKDEPDDIGIVQTLINIDSTMAELACSPPTQLRDEMIISNIHLPDDLHTEQIERTARNIPIKLLPLYVICALRPYVDKDLIASERLDVLNYISLANQGVIAYYVQSQKRDKISGKYEGNAVIVGLCNKIKFRVHVKDQEITKICSDNPTNLYNNRTIFCRFLKKLNCSIKSSNSKSESPIIDSSLKISKRGCGMKILRQEIRIPDAKDIRLSISVNHHQGVTLKFTADQLTGDSISYYPSYQRKAEYIEIDDVVMDSWLNSKVLKVKDLKYLLKEETMNWSVYTLRQRCQQLQVVKQGLPDPTWCTDEISVNESNLSDFGRVDINDIIEILAGDLFNEIGDTDSLDQIMSEQEQWNSLLDSISDDLKIFDERYEIDVYDLFNHSKNIHTRNKPFWDDFIELIKKSLDRETQSIDMSNYGPLIRELLTKCGFKEQTLSPYFFNHLNI